AAGGLEGVSLQPRLQRPQGPADDVQRADDPAAPFRGFRRPSRIIASKFAGTIGFGGEPIPSYLRLYKFNDGPACHGPLRHAVPAVRALAAGAQITWDKPCGKCYNGVACAGGRTRNDAATGRGRTGGFRCARYVWALSA